MIKIIDPVIFEIFSVEVRWYAFLIISAVVISLLILEYLVKNDKKIEFEFFLDFLIFALPAAVLGARLYYVIFNIDYYLRYPQEILAVNQGGLAIHGAAGASLIVLYIICQRKNIGFLSALDYISPVFVLGQSIGRWGNFINQEAYGRIVSQNYYSFFPDIIKKQMYIDGYYREPTFLYESAANLFIFIFLIYYLKKKDFVSGDIFAIYLILYSFFRYFIEELRVDSLYLYNIQAAKLVSVMIIFGGVYILYKNHYSSR